MDFAIVPGITPYEKLLERVMNTRTPKTTLINKTGVNSIADFLKELEAQAKQGGDLLVGAHASRRTFAVKFDTTTPVPTASNGRDYEMLEAVSAAGTMHIPPTVKGANTSFHLKGCQIGADEARPLLTLFKTALDNPVTLTAPKYPHVLTDDAGQGVFEYMRYSYEVKTPTVFADRAAILAAFQATQVKPFMQGVEVGMLQVPVPVANFAKWLPSDKEINSMTDDIDLPITVRLSPKIGKNTVIWKSGTFAALPDTYSASMDMTGRTIPPDDPGRIAIFRQQLKTSANMQSSHPYPVYTRMGFPDYDTFFNGLTWSVTLQQTSTQSLLQFVGMQFIYRLEIPIVKKGTSLLIFNYYPKSGTPTMAFKEDNAKFEMFGVV